MTAYLDAKHRDEDVDQYWVGKVWPTTYVRRCTMMASASSKWTAPSGGSPAPGRWNSETAGRWARRWRPCCRAIPSEYHNVIRAIAGATHPDHPVSYRPRLADDLLQLAYWLKSANDAEERPRASSGHDQVHAQEHRRLTKAEEVEIQASMDPLPRLLKPTEQWADEFRVSQGWLSRPTVAPMRPSWPLADA